MKKNNIYYDTILWSSVLTALFGCSHNRATNRMQEEGCSSASEEKISNRLFSLSLSSSGCDIDQLIGKYEAHIKKCMQTIEDYQAKNSTSIFNERRFDKLIESFVEFLEKNDAKLKNSKLLSLSMPDFSGAPVGYQKPLIQNAAHLIRESDDPYCQDPNYTYLRSLIHVYRSLSPKIENLDQHKLMKDPEALLHSVEEMCRANKKKIAHLKGSTLDASRPMNRQLNRLYGKTKKQWKESTHQDPTDTNDFEDKVNDYILYSFLDYFYKLFNVLIIHAFNESVSQRKMQIKEARKQYQDVYGLIISIYSARSINQYASEVQSLLNVATAYKPGKQPPFSDVTTMNRLSGDYFKSIDDKVHKIHALISKIPYDRDPGLKDEAAQVVNLLYNIVSIYVTSGMLLHFSNIAEVYRVKLANKSRAEIAYFAGSYAALTLNCNQVNLSKFILLGDLSAKQKVDESIQGYIEHAKFIVRK